MLANFLKLNQRGQRRLSSDKEVVNFNNNLSRLHADDSAVTHYFQLNREQLLSYINEPANELPLNAAGECALNDLRTSIYRLEAIDTESATSPENPQAFYWFYYRFQIYFNDCFKADERYKTIANGINEPTLLLSFEDYVLDTVKRTAEPSLVHCLNTQLAQGNALDLADFNQQLKTSSLTFFFESYPVLAAVLFELLDDTLNYVYAVVLDFADDIDALQGHFSITSRSIDAIELGLGDRHGRGETVCRVEAGGTSLIYKPRASREALFFNHLLERLHESSGAECFAVHAPTILSYERHSWIEKIDNLPCESEADVELFYQKMGAQIALIHALNGIDFHYENIIARGNSPVMIDLECLFTGSISDLLLELPKDSALFNAFKLTRHSVFSSGFVPFAQGSGNDLSGLTTQEKFTSTRQSLIVENGFYHLKRIRTDYTPRYKHLPLLAGETRSVEAYKDIFFEAFECAYDQLIAQRHMIIEMLEQSASKLSTRVLIKNTQRYADFIALSRHPRFMQNMLDRELLLATLWGDLKVGYQQRSIPQYEIADLQRSSIPCFTMTLDSNGLQSAQGVMIEMSEIAPPLESCVEKIATLSLKDRALQRTILDTCLFPKANDCLPLNLKHAARDARKVSREACISGARKVAALIEHFSVTGNESDIRWLSFHTHPTTHRKYLSPMGNGLYSGISGLGLFYLSLFKVTGNPRELECADNILHSLERSFGYFKGDLSISAFHGRGSYIYLLAMRQQISKDQKYAVKLEELLQHLITAPFDDYDFDFLGGCCGAVTLLANLHQLHPQEALIPAIQRMVEYLKSEVMLEDDRCVRRKDHSVVLTGLSHGLSGVIFSLCKAYEVTGDAALVPLAVRLIEGENRRMQDGFWLDLRDLENPGHLSKWCHGDAGILLARRQLLKSMGGVLDESTRQRVNEDILQCKDNLWRHGLGSGYSLCHGDFGNLMCLYDVYRESGDLEGINRVERAFDEVTQSFFEKDFLDGNQVPDMSLFTGISGVGYALLYRIDATLPNPLSLDVALRP